MFFYRSQNHLNYYKFCYDTTETYEVISALRRDYRRAQCEKRSSKARRGSLTDHSDDSKSRSEITTTESSPACSTWTDTFSSEPKSLPIDPPDGIEGETRPSVSYEQVQENIQTLVVKLPPEKPSPSKDNTKSGPRKKSESLELVALTKKSESPVENNKTSNEEVKNNSDKKDKENKAKSTLKAVLASIKNPKRILLASGRPVSSANEEPKPGTSKESDPIPEKSKKSDPEPVTSKESDPIPGPSKDSDPIPARSKDSDPLPESSQSEIYVRQLVKKRVAAQSSRVTHSSKQIKQTKLQTYSDKINVRLKVLEDHSPDTLGGVFRSTSPPSPAPPAPADPIVKARSQTFFLADDGIVYVNSTVNCRRSEKSRENRAETDYVDAACAEKRRPTVKKVLFSDSTPIDLESSFYSVPTNIGASYDFQKLPHNDSEYELKRFQPLNIPSTSHGYQNFDYDSLNIFEPRRYDSQNPEEDFSRQNRPCRYLPAVGKEFERRSKALYRQLEEDRVKEQHQTDHYEVPKRAVKKQQYSKPESAFYEGDRNRPVRHSQKITEDKFIQPSNSAERRKPRDHSVPVHTDRQQNRTQYSDQTGQDSLTNEYYERRRQHSQAQDHHSRQFQGRQSVQPRDIQADQFQSREINQPRERLLKQNTESPNVGRTRLQHRQPQHTVQKKPHAAPQSKKDLDEQQTTTSKNNKYQTHTNRPGDRPANSFWRRDFVNQIELESPPEVYNTVTLGNEFRFANSSERNNQKYPKVESSPLHRRRYSDTSVYIYLDELEPPLREERYSNLYRQRKNPLARKPYPERHMGRMGSLEDHERKVIIEFCHLLEKSKQLFNGLRELPQYGHKQWHSYFGRTFDVYTKLWKFQQQHRAVLDNKYGMKRWQIGEIASKIGQLYYHFYLRTSETAYLSEAFSFYYAIRGRSYYTKACKEDKCELMVKKLRYYARFIVVCLLLKKVKLVRDLIKELDRQIIEYGSTYDPDDQIEWTVVVDEVKAFVQTEPIVQVIHPDNYPVPLSHRLSPLTTPPVERSQQMNLSLHEALIVGSSSQQVKFSELTMDMYRMLQTLEREPTGEIQHMYDDSPRQRFNLTPSALNNKGYNLESGAPRSDNPHKYLLFKPSPSQILVYLASACNDLPPNGALLLYISADGQIVQPSKHPEDGYDNGGLITTSKNELHRDSNKDKSSQAKNRELQCFHPGDLFPFTRRPLFIIIDSDNSTAFQNIPRHFGQPMVILMSPVEMPSGLHIPQSERKQQGSLFTLFLHSPLTAICYCSDLHSVPLIHWDRAQAYIDTFLAEASQILTRGRIDTMFLSFMGDDFLRLLILRYMFCELVMRMHRAFRTRAQRPRSAPGIPDEILEHPALVHIVFDLATHLQIRPSFQEPNGNVERTSKE